jgi:hypothetical protein
MAPESSTPQLKDPKLYDTLRDDGASPEKAARISNAAAASSRREIGRRGGSSGSYTEWTVHNLRARARDLGLTGYSGLTKDKLVEMLRDH